MEYIDKITLANEAEKVVKSFLESFISDGIANYPTDLYDAFSRDVNANGNRYRGLLKTILYREQQNRCCYCMKKLDGETFEHVIPDSTTDKTTFGKYLNSNICLNDRNICIADDFVNNKTTNYPPYPHTIAHINLTLSCCSKNHCNHYRENKPIKPIMFYRTIRQDIEYKSNGFVIWKKETELTAPTIETLGLNDDTLRMIRRIWLFANRENINLLSLDKNKRDDFMYMLIPEIENNEEDTLLKFLKNEKEWNKVEKYDYFASYKLTKEIKSHPSAVILDNHKRKKYCRFKKNGIKYIDYKDSEYLKKFLNEQGKILPRHITGNSLKFQRKVAQAVKRARHLALLPYVTDLMK